MDYLNKRKLASKLRYKFFVHSKRKKNLLKTAKIFIRRSKSNFILTMTDMRNKVIVCCTSGSSIKEQCTKKRRISPYAMEDIVTSLNIFFFKFNIKRVRLVLKMRTGMVVRFLFKELLKKGIQIFRVDERLICAHNGVRRRKLQRK